MAKGKFVVRHKRDKFKNFVSFDSDETGAECTEATNAENLGLRLAARSACRFKQIESGASLVFGDWEYFVEWRESIKVDELPLAKVIRDCPNIELIHIN